MGDSAVRVSAPARRRAGQSVAFDESQCVVRMHRADPAAKNAAIDAALTRLAGDKRTGDVMTILKEFRDSPRGE